MAEEHGFQSPEGPRLCANNCGFFGSAATQNYCSKCYRDLFLKDPNPNPNPNPNPSSSSPDPLFSLKSSSPISFPKESDSLEEASLQGGGGFGGDAGRSTVSEAAVQAVAQPNRCSVCKKKVGLTGFRCRCGTTFCGTHRYPEQHGCAFDFKAMGREAIAKANPVVKADKLEKI